MWNDEFTILHLIGWAFSYVERLAILYLYLPTIQFTNHGLWIPVNNKITTDSTFVTT